MTLKSTELTKLAITEARRWLGVAEERQNSGQLINLFQAAAKISDGDSWCMAFVQFVLQATARQAKALGTDVTLSIPVSGHCWTVWHNTPALYRFSEPAVGRLVLWNKTGTTDGHAGIITDVWSKTSFSTLEGNTSSTSTSVVRNGGEVVYKKRSTAGTSTMKILGYIDPWAVIK